MARRKPETRNSAYLGAFASRDATPQVIGRSRKILGHGKGKATDRALSLEQAEEHIAEGEAHIRRQRKLIDWLENRGHDTALAKEVLAIFEMMQTHHVTERERLLKEKSTYLGTYIFGEKARGHLRRAEGRLDLLAEQLNAVQVQLGIARDVIAECQSSVGLIEDVLKALDVLRRANTEAVSGGEDSTERPYFPPTCVEKRNNSARPADASVRESHSVPRASPMERALRDPGDSFRLSTGVTPGTSRGSLSMVSVSGVEADQSGLG